MSAAVEELRAALGADKVRVGREIPLRNQQDATGGEPSEPLALLLPRTSEDVATALTICCAHGQAVVPQGGMTGLAGAARPGPAEIAISLERMSGIEEVDQEAATLTALAGTPLGAIRAASLEAGFVCGIDLGARDTCTIGGNVATNAGGNQVLRYGMTRRNVLGLEAVLPDGTILRSLNKMLKNNAGYDWTQLFIGSEGTLGIITRVVIALQPRPAGIETALIALPSIRAATATLRAAGRALPGGLQAFEAMWSDFLAVAVDRLGLSPPFERDYPLVVLIEIQTDGTAAGREGLEVFLAAQMEAGAVADAVIAQSEQQRARLWAYRESPYQYARIMPPCVNFDVSVPIGLMDEVVTDLRRDLAESWPAARPVFFGHVADSNLHLIVPLAGLDAGTKHDIETTVYERVARAGGSVSAEHGIGLAKTDYLALCRSGPELALMRTVKAALDPRGILSPGRIFPDGAAP